MAELRLSRGQLEQMGAHLSACLPEEACGMVGGTGQQAGLVLTVENQLHSPTRFMMEPMAQYRAMLEIEKAGMDLLAIFHSHPHGPVHPSATDVAEFYYPGTLVLIASPMPQVEGIPPAGSLTFGTWQIRGFHIHQLEILGVELDYND